MKGLSGTTATLQAGVQSAMQTAGLVAGAGLTAAGAAATFGGSAAVRAAIEGTRTAAEGTTAAGRIANDFAGAGGFAPGATSSESSGGGTSDILAPPRLAPATVGESFENPSNRAQVAHQTTPDSFSVTDSARKTISHHKGNIFTPYAAQAAFNSHSSKAQPVGPPPLPTSEPV
jgi:hypothetical protein